MQCDRGKRAKRIERRVTNTLPSFLALTYAAIARRAPRATVVVLGYPRLFPGRGQAEPRCFANKLPRARQLFLNRAVLTSYLLVVGTGLAGEAQAHDDEGATTDRRD